MPKPVIIDKSAGVLKVTLNRPDKKNALSMEMYELMSAGLSQAAADDSIKAVLISANGDSFSAGNDLEDFSAVNKGAVALMELPTVGFMKSLMAFEKPVVAAVQGMAVGIGTTLLLHCDVVVAGRSAIFSLPFTQLGLVPEFGSTYILPALAGKVCASQVLLLGESFGIDKASQFGIVSTVCDDAEVAEKAMEKCLGLTALPAKTLRDVKRLIRSALNPEKLNEAFDTELRLFAQALKSDEHRQALAVFFNKKP